VIQIGIKLPLQLR